MLDDDRAADERARLDGPRSPAPRDHACARSPTTRERPTARNARSTLTRGERWSGSMSQHTPGASNPRRPASPIAPERTRRARLPRHLQPSQALRHGRRRRSAPPLRRERTRHVRLLLPGSARTDTGTASEIVPVEPVLQSALVRVAPDSSQKPGAVHGTRSYFGVRKPRSRAGTDRRGLRAAAWNAANWTLACPTACDWLAASCRCSSRPPPRRCSRPPAGCHVRVRGCACPRRPG